MLMSGKHALPFFQLICITDSGALSAEKLPNTSFMPFIRCISSFLSFCAGYCSDITRADTLRWIHQSNTSPAPESLLSDCSLIRKRNFLHYCFRSVALRLGLAFSPPVWELLSPGVTAHAKNRTAFFIIRISPLNNL